MKSKPKFGIKAFISLFLLFSVIVICMFYPDWKRFEGGNIEFSTTIATCTGAKGSGDDTRGYYKYEVEGTSYRAEDHDDVSSRRSGDTRDIYYNPENPKEYTFGFKNLSDSISAYIFVIKFMAVLISPWIIIHFIRLGIWALRKKYFE